MKNRACRRNLTRISALIDNELPPVQRRRLEAHLAVCPDCSRYLESLRACSALLRALPPVEPSEEAILELKARLRMATHIVGEEKICEMIRVRLSAYMDNELPGPERQRVEQHLAVCPDCSSYLESLRVISGHLHLLPVLEPRPAAVESLKAKVRSAQAVGRRGSAPIFAFPRFAHVRLGLSAAAVVLLAVALFMFSQLGHRGNVAGLSVKPTSIEGASLPSDISQKRVVNLVAVELETGKKRLLAELKLDEGAKTQDTEEAHSGLEVFDPTESRTHGRIMHSIIFGERRAARAPVASHVLFASYGE